MWVHFKKHKPSWDNLSLKRLIFSHQPNSMLMYFNNSLGTITGNGSDYPLLIAL